MPFGFLHELPCGLAAGPTERPDAATGIRQNRFAAAPPTPLSRSGFQHKIKAATVLSRARF